MKRSILALSAVLMALGIAHAQSSTPSSVEELVQVVAAIPQTLSPDFLSSDQASSLDHIAKGLYNQPFLSQTQANDDLAQIKDALGPEEYARVMQAAQQEGQPIVDPAFSTNPLAQYQLYSDATTKLEAFAESGQVN
jgi:acyl-CoA synthetase (AMP-forming)/AMP-acid ligase II